MSFLADGISAVTFKELVMYIVGAALIWLAIKKDYEPALLLPMGFGAILVNLPLSGVVNQTMAGIGETAVIFVFYISLCYKSIICFGVLSLID